MCRTASLSSLMLPPSALHASPRNARRHPPEQVSQLAASIRAHGFGAPIITDGSGEILAGHGRLLAAIEAGLDLVPVIRVSGITPDEADTFRLLDNRLGELSTWDQDALKAELAEIQRLCPAADVDALLASLRLAIPDLQAAELLPLTRSELVSAIQRMRADFAEDISGGFDLPPRRLSDCIDTSAGEAVLSDPAFSESPPELQDIIRAAATQLYRVDYRAVRAYYNAAPPGSPIRRALQRNGDVVPLSASGAVSYMAYFDALAEAFLYDFSGGQCDGRIVC